MAGKIILFGGSPGAGKSTTAKALAKRFARGVHFETDLIREFVVSGRADPIPWTEETTRQFAIARENVCFMADNYCRNGFVVTIDDVLTAPTDYVELLTTDQVHTVFLKPDKAVCIERNLQRTNKDFDTQVLVEFIGGFCDQLETELHPQLWDLVLDNGDLTLEENVEQIMQLLQGQVVD